MPSRAGAPGITLEPDHRLLNSVRANVVRIGAPVNMKPAADTFHHRIDSFAADFKNFHAGRVRAGRVFMAAYFESHRRAGKTIIARSNPDPMQHPSLPA